MKKILLALLFCLLLETILSEKTTKKMKLTKAIKDIKVKHLRKEENTDQATDASMMVMIIWTRQMMIIIQLNYQK